MRSDHKTRALQSLGLQAVVTLVLAAPLFLGWSPGTAGSALAGGGLAMIGNALGIGLVFGHYRASDPGALASRMMGAGLARLVVAAAGFAIIFSQYPEVVVWALFGSFILVHLIPAGWMHRATGPERKR